MFRRSTVRWRWSTVTCYAVVSRFYLLETLFVLGYPDRALTLCREALAEARGLSPALGLP